VITSPLARPIPVSDLDLRLSRLGRGERLITWSRVALAAFALLAVWLDPSEPARYAQLAYGLLMAYVVHSVILALVFTSTTRPLRKLTVATHVIDLAVAVAVNAMTGPGSPFFVLFVFLLAAATLRWQWRGTLLTGAAALAAYLAMGFFGYAGMGEAEFELNRFVIRGSYLAVVAVLLGTLGTWEDRLRRDLVELAGWPRRRKQPSFEAAAREALAYAAGILRAPRLMLAWEDAEEPWLETLLWRDGELLQERHDPGVLSPLVDDAVAESAFLCLDLSSAQPTVLHTAGDGLLAWRGQPLHDELARRVDARNVLSVPVIGEGVNARLFAFDKSRPSSDDLVVGLILGRQIVGVLEQHVLVEETENAAANAERMRLARELHDGIAQSLAGAALQISGVRRTLGADPAAASRLDDIETLLVHEQRELRLFMQELRPSSTVFEREGALPHRLDELCARVSRLWGIEVEAVATGELAAPLAWEVYRLVQEALVNAARHAGATRVQVTVASTEDGARLRIADDGRGFPFRGAYDLATLNARAIGPVSLKERVAALRGDLLVRSSDQGTVIEISIPASRALSDAASPLPAG
jgi:signal transduction histidine kinase